jgi:hypothetical protein
MLGESGSESTVVDAPEKSVGRVELVSARRREAIELDGFVSEGWTWVVRDSSECRGRSGGEGGRHCAHSRGRTCVHKTDLGPCASQKCVSESCRLSQCHVTRPGQAYNLL